MRKFGLGGKSGVYGALTLAFVEFIDVSGNQLTAIPSRVFDTRKLNNLVLSNNKIASLPDTIGNATSLEVLLISV